MREKEKRIFKKYSTQTFLELLAATVVIEIVGYFLDGYCLENRDFSIILFFMFPIRILLIFLVFGQIIRSIISRGLKWRYLILCFLLISISMVPKEHYLTFGKIAYMDNSDPPSVLVEVRNMMDIYEPLTHFGSLHRMPLNNPRSLNEVPPIIKKFHKGEVLVLENAVLLESGSLVPSFSGFVIFREGFDPWVNEKQIVLQDFWYVSWKIRIIDGLYWYKVNGYDNPFLEPIYQLENYGESAVGWVANPP